MTPTRCALTIVGAYLVLFALGLACDPPTGAKAAGVLPELLTLPGGIAVSEGLAGAELHLSDLTCVLLGGLSNALLLFTFVWLFAGFSAKDDPLPLPPFAEIMFSPRAGWRAKWSDLRRGAGPARRRSEPPRPFPWDLTAGR